MSSGFNGGQKFFSGTENVDGVQDLPFIDSEGEADAALKQSVSDNKSDTGPTQALAKLGCLTIKTQSVSSPNCTGRLGHCCRRQPSAAHMPIYSMSSRSPLASGSRKLVAKNDKDRVMTPPCMSKVAKSRALGKKCRISKSPSPIWSPSACSGSSWSPLSTSTIQPVLFQPGSSAAVNPPAWSTPVCRLAPQSEFLLLLASPSSLTHDEAYQQAQILAARRVDHL
ncbi:hypothetical protein BJ165DRAFT_1531784 [Panaeolus papilionaceus]|nr:hypothetical protein BJ165DRAFT_1531784 [Panaeolus papilionaceus]